MEKNTVTRTFSIGAISSGVRASDDVSAARRHSSAGIRALLWATGSVKSSGSSQGSDFQTSRENLFPNILTPGSIPRFTIPSLSVQSSLRSLDQEDVSESEESSGGSGADPSSSLLSSISSSSGLSLAPSVRRAERSISDPFGRRSFPHGDAPRPCSHTDLHRCLGPLQPCRAVPAPSGQGHLPVRLHYLEPEPADGERGGSAASSRAVASKQRRRGW